MRERESERRTWWLRHCHQSVRPGALSWREDVRPVFTTRLHVSSVCKVCLSFSQLDIIRVSALEIKNYSPFLSPTVAPWHTLRKYKGKQKLLQAFQCSLVQTSNPVTRTREQSELFRFSMKLIDCKDCLFGK